MKYDIILSKVNVIKFQINIKFYRKTGGYTNVPLTDGSADMTPNYGT